MGSDYLVHWASVVGCVLCTRLHSEAVADSSGWDRVGSASEKVCMLILLYRARWIGVGLWMSVDAGFLVLGWTSTFIFFLLWSWTLNSIFLPPCSNITT